MHTTTDNSARESHSWLHFRWHGGCLLAAMCVSISPAFGTSITPTPLPELVREADNIVVGKIVAVRMRDGRGREIKDPEAWTGPGLDNTIYYEVETIRVLKSNASPIPARLELPLWQMWHMTLDGMESLVGVEAVFLLDSNMKPMSAPEFVQSIDDRNRIREFVYLQSPERKERLKRSRPFKR